MEQENTSKTLIKGALILTIAALITKILSAFYRIPFQNIVGDVGFYIYQQAYPFYGVAVVLATTGFPVVISKLYAEQKEKDTEFTARQLLILSFIYLQGFGIICFSVLYFGAGHLAQWMDDPQLALLIRVVSLVFLTFPISSILRGYYQGIGNMTPTALSQVGEQLIRVGTILFISWLFMQKGVSLYLVGGGAMLGSITGSILSAIILIMFLWIRKEWKGIAFSKDTLWKYKRETMKLCKTLTFQGLAICLSSMILIFIQLADALNLYSLLLSMGVDEEAAKGLKGVFDRGQPLIQLGTVAATSISLALVPLITKERLMNKQDLVYPKMQLALKVSIVIGMGASFGLWAIIEPVNTLLYKNNQGSSVLGILSFVILITSLLLTGIAILQGLGNHRFPAIASLCLFPLKYFLNSLLVPEFGTTGAAMATILSLVILTIVVLYKVSKAVQTQLFSIRTLGITILAALIMVLLLKAYNYGLDTLLDSSQQDRGIAALESLSGVVLGGTLYLWVIIKGKVFLQDELTLFPLGSKLKHFIARKDRD